MRRKIKQFIFKMLKFIQNETTCLKNIKICCENEAVRL